MKFKFSLKNKEVSLDANVERLVEKSLDYKAQNPPRKTAYQIRQEEKRKTEEMKHKQQLQWMFILLGLVAVCIVGGIIASILGV